jgi:hypothetical protein
MGDDLKNGRQPKIIFLNGKQPKKIKMEDDLKYNLKNQPQLAVT